MRTIHSIFLLGLASCALFPQQDRDATAADRSGPAALQDFELVPLKYASAEEIAKVLNDFLAIGSGPGANGANDVSGNAAAPRNASARKVEPSIRVVADPRTNSILVQGPREDLPRVLELVSKLDRKVP